MVSARTSFFTSKEPQSVGTPYVKKSRDSWLRKVVLPEPVAPVTSENSPMRSPDAVLLKKLKYCD